MMPDERRVEELLERIEDPALRAEVREFSGWTPEEQRHHLYMQVRTTLSAVATMKAALAEVNVKLDKVLDDPTRKPPTWIDRALGGGGLVGLLAYVLYDLGVVKR